MRPKIQTGIVGTGSLGSSLAKSLAATGYPLHTIVSRHKASARTLAAATGASHASRLAETPIEGLGLVFLCVPDDVIAKVAHLLAEKDYAWNRVVVAHTSGALPADILSPLSEKGAHPVSFHPVQTFKEGSSTAFENIYVGLEGNEHGIEVLRGIVTDLRAIPLVLSTEEKVRYHAAATITSNFFVTLVSVGCDLLESIGLDRTGARNLLEPLIQQTCSNVISAPPETALTGPAVRGDIDTIRHHVEALDKYFPSYMNLYKSLTREAFNIAIRTGRIPPEREVELLARFDELYAGK